MLSKVPIVLQMCRDSLGKKQNENVPPFPALETVPVLLFVALAFGNNSSPLVYFLDVWPGWTKL